MLARFMQGFYYALQGCKDVFNPKIRQYVVFPLLINLLIFSIIFYFSMNFTVDFIEHFSLDFLPEWSWLATVVKILKWIVMVISFLIYLAVFSFVFTITSNLFACSLNSFLCESFSIKVLNSKLPTSPTIIHLIKSTFAREGKKLMYYLPRTVVLSISSIILFFIPGLNFLLPFIFYGFTAWGLAIQYIDYPAENEQLSFKSTLEQMKRQKSLYLGFGAGMLVVNSIPVMNLIAMPAGVLGASRLWYRTHSLISSSNQT